jgi:sigma-B regulation protein RsbU (phosphoserine phosphatase)
MEILVAGKDQRMLRGLERDLAEAGHSTFSADSSAAVWKNLIEKPRIALVILGTDIDSSGGVELGRRIKEKDWGRFLYLIRITSVQADSEVTGDIEGGAMDDCLSRPFTRRELWSRVQTGRKIIRLSEKLRNVMEDRRSDLRSGREAQTSLIPMQFPDIPNMEIAARFIPSAYVSGDLYDIFRLDEEHVGLFSVDVSGHGIAAALFSVELRQRLSSQLQPGGVLKVPINAAPFYCINPPEKVMEILDQDDTLATCDRYFTMVYAIVELPKSQVTFSRAGHNPPLVIKSDGSAHYQEAGGAPIGLGIVTPTRERHLIDLGKGDSFILFSDGINETFSRSGKNGYGLSRVRDILRRYCHKNLGESFDALMADVKQHRGSADFSDDISIIGFRWKGS